MNSYPINLTVELRHKRSRRMQQLTGQTWTDEHDNQFMGDLA